MEAELRIRNAIETDVEEIYRIHTEAIKKKCSTRYGAEDVSAWVARQEKAKYLPFIVANEIIVAEIVQSRRVVGFGHLTADTGADSDETADGKAMQIRGLFADPDCGVKGVGTALVKELENRAKEFGAVRVKANSSLNAVEFYKKCGFFALDITRHQISEQSCLQCQKMIKYL
ncbi:hypothetical protein pdam_00018225 [Pocillopora damicornis]|uniref:N-acetyltransferase domain-containing protein n=1 Tax=Pocillopora damicornis TaxID=46731 RepID=A0A3M6U7F0_POCDA|nr:uncharacterized protein LOC113667986 [Pocillopora damicornis]RMX49388.1 hypothetical protein pdam_00018225 [Pocillopora damicornis]